MTTRSRRAAAADRQILAASFSTVDGGSRAAAALAAAFPGQLGNIAVLHVASNGTLKFVETKDWGAGRGALVGGLIGLLGGPVGIVAGSALGILATRLRDAGFADQELTRLGRTLARDNSAFVLEISRDTIGGAERVLAGLDVREVVIVPIGSDVAGLFAEERMPTAS